MRAIKSYLKEYKRDIMSVFANLTNPLSSYNRVNIISMENQENGWRGLNSNGQWGLQNGLQLRRDIWPRPIMNFMGRKIRLAVLRVRITQLFFENMI